MKKALVLLVSILLFYPYSGMAAETGYVVGQVIFMTSMASEGGQVRMGAPGGDQREKYKVKIAHVKEDYTETLFTVDTDRDGYFYLSDMPLDGVYRVSSIQGPDMTDALPSIVPPPDQSGGTSGKIFIAFSSGHEANVPIIDMGRTVFTVIMPEEEAAPGFAVERHYSRKKAVLDSTDETPFELIEGDYGYPGLRHYVRSGPKDLQGIAQAALEDREQFDKAERLKEEADQLCESDKEAAIAKYRQAVETYPAYLDACDDLVGLLAEMERKDDAVSTLEDALQNCPSSDELYVHCRLAAQYYMAAGDAKKAIPHYEKYLSLRPDNNWAIVYLAKAYIADSRFEDARDKVNQGNKSVIYYAVHFDFEKANRVSDTKEMLEKAIATYGDGSLSKSLEDIKTKLASLP